MVSNDSPLRPDSAPPQSTDATASGGALALSPQPPQAGGGGRALSPQPPEAVPVERRVGQPAVTGRMPLGFGLALVVLVALGAITQASIADLVTGAASVTRSVQALERLHALKATVRELEASELAILLTGRPQYKESYDTA